MADKKVDATTGEVQEQEEKKFQYFDRQKESLEGIAYNPDNAIKVIRVHCKPVYNYQSVEFDWEIPCPTGPASMTAQAEMEGFYLRMLHLLVRVSEAAPQKDAKPAAPVEEPASEKQKEILRNFHIDFKPDITKKQAHALIKKSMDQEIF